MPHMDEFLKFQSLLEQPYARWRRAQRDRAAPCSFVCIHCRNPVLTYSWISGVQNRNHCPYCLRSRHLDLHQPGDRLSACKGIMHPIGLTLKRTYKKYGSMSSGELMLIHQCQECGKVSLNRIAADDDPQLILAIYIASLSLDPELRALLAQNGIQPLCEQELPVLRRGLLGAVQEEFNQF